MHKVEVNLPVDYSIWIPNHLCLFSEQKQKQHWALPDEKCWRDGANSMLLQQKPSLDFDKLSRCRICQFMMAHAESSCLYAHLSHLWWFIFFEAALQADVFWCFCSRWAWYLCAERYLESFYCTIKTSQISETNCFCRLRVWVQLLFIKVGGLSVWNSVFPSCFYEKDTASSAENSTSRPHSPELQLSRTEDVLFKQEATEPLPRMSRVAGIDGPREISPAGHVRLYFWSPTIIIIAQGFWTQAPMWARQAYQSVKR